jgi:putative glutamine amidotransferase
VIGVIGNAFLFDNRFSVQLVGTSNLRAIMDVAEAFPLMFAGSPHLTPIDDLLEHVDGVLLTGARANVHPVRFKAEPHPKHEPYDEDRDAVALPLIETCVARGVPLFGICRGFQEMNVAFGGSLHPEIHPDPEVVFSDRHDVRLVQGGVIAQLLGQETIRVNSLHGQGILDLGERVVVEGVAEDGTIEAIRIAEAPAFALGVQWHAEYDPQSNPINRSLFRSFGQAVKAYHSARR